MHRDELRWSGNPSGANLLIGRAACSGFLLGLLPAGIVHFALVEARRSVIMEQGNGRIEVGPKAYVPISSWA